METNKSLIKIIEKDITDLFEENLPFWALYHNLNHTIETVEGCKMIGLGSNINEDDMNKLIIASWFHDVGYLESDKNHEELSSQRAREYLLAKKISKDSIKSVTDLILSTKLKNKPNNLLEQIICDADLISLGQENYSDLNEKLKQEIELREARQIKDISWLKRSLKFLSKHEYYTDFAKEEFKLQFKKNKILLEKKISDRTII